MRSDKDLKNFIFDSTSWMEKDIHCKQRAWHIKNDIRASVLCSICNKNPVKFTQGRYNRFCSRVCATKDPTVEAKRAATCNKKFGDASSARNPEMKKIKERTCIKRYGAKSPSLNKKIRKKQKQTMKERYGSEYPGSSKIIQDRINETCLIRYGKPWSDVTNSVQNLNKKKRTRINKKYSIVCG